MKNDLKHHKLELSINIFMTVFGGFVMFINAWAFYVILNSTAIKNMSIVGICSFVITQVVIFIIYNFAFNALRKDRIKIKNKINKSISSISNPDK